MSEPKVRELVVGQDWPRAMLTVEIRPIIEGRILTEAGQRLIGLLQDGRSYRITCWMGWEELDLKERYQVRVEWEEADNEDQT